MSDGDFIRRILSDIRNRYRRTIDLKEFNDTLTRIAERLDALDDFQSQGMIENLPSQVDAKKAKEGRL